MLVNISFQIASLQTAIVCKYTVISFSEFLVDIFFVFYIIFLLQAKDDYISSDVRWRMEQTSYIKEQYTLTRCSLGSERGVFSSCSPPADSLFLGMDAGLFSCDLERVQPQHSHSLTHWDTSWKQKVTSSVQEMSKKVRNKL